MSDIQKGYSFSGTSPNNSVTAEKLNTLVDEAKILAGFYTDKGENTSAAEGDYLLIYESASGTYRKITKGHLITSGVARSGAVNLRIFANTATELSIQADEIVMRSTSGNLRLATGFSSIPSITTYSGGSTANGRDFATETNDVFYYIWAISDGVNDRSLLSTSATSPTLPSGYLYKALLGAVRNDHAGDFVRFSQRNQEVALAAASAAGTASSYLNPYTGAAEFTDVGPTTARVFQAVDLSRCIPPNLTGRVRGLLGSSVGGTTPNHSYVVATRGAGYLTGTGADPNAGLPTFAWGLQILEGLAVSANKLFGFNNAVAFEVPIYNSQQIDWACSSTAAVHNMRITGWTLNL